MKIKNDMIKIQTAAMDAQGNKLEPEAQPAARVISTDANVNGTNQKALGALNSEIVLQTTAGEIANGVRRQCFQCKHFDTDAFRQYRRNCEVSPHMDKRREINAIRAALLETQNVRIAERHVDKDGEMDAEHALQFLGICHPLTEIHSDAVVVYPIGTCPDEVCTPSQPNGLFTPKSSEADRQSAKSFDEIMLRAAGKKP